MLEIRNEPRTHDHAQRLRTALACPDRPRPTHTRERPRPTQKKETMVAPWATHFHYRRCGGHPLGGWGLRRYICIDINIQCVMFFGTGEAGESFFLVFSSGCIPWGRRLDTVKGEGGGWVKCFKAFHPSPPFKVYKGVPLFCGTLGI